jgi:hypothetical protein
VGMAAKGRGMMEGSGFGGATLACSLCAYIPYKMYLRLTLHSTNQLRKGR